MMKILIFTVSMLFLIIPQVAYGSEISAEPEKILFGPNEWVKIFIEVDGYLGGDVKWNALLPDGTSIDGVFSNLQASKIIHSIPRDAFDGQFGTWQIKYEYNDAVKIIDIEVEPLVVSLTTDQLSYLPGSIVTTKFSTNYYNPIAANAETVFTDILNEERFSVIPTGKLKTKVFQPVIIQQFEVNELIQNNSFGVFHAVVSYYDILVDTTFEIENPNPNTSIFFSANRQSYYPNDPVEVRIIMQDINAESGILSVISPSKQLTTKIISITDSLTRVTLDDINTSDVGIYVLQFEYGTSNITSSFEILETSKEDNIVSDYIEIALNKSQYRPGETIQVAISTDKIMNEQIIYWFVDSSGNQSNQFSFANPTSGTFTIPIILSPDFSNGTSKLHVKYGSAETFTIFSVSGEAMIPEEIKVAQYDGPEILLTIDDKIVNFSEITDISISPNLELFVLDSGDSKIKVFDISGNLIKTWGTFGSEEGELNNPTSILAEKSQIHVSDAVNSRIVTFDNDGNFIRDWGNSGFAHQLVKNPTDIAVDGDGIYYISDGNQNKILKFDATGTYVGEINSILTASAKFSSTESITTNGDDDIFLLSTNDNRILNFHSNGGFLKSFGTEGQSNKQFQDPVSLEFVANDYLYVADSGNNRVLVMSTAGDYVTKWGVFGNGPGQFNQMTGIDVDLNGNIWVADSSNRIQKFAVISYVNENSVPEWFSQVEKWKIENIISIDEFNQAREYLIDKGIINVN